MTKKKIAAFVILGLLIIFLGWRFFGNKQPKPQYQTAKAEKGTLIQTVTASGQVSAANNTSVTTQASGVVSKVFIKNDQTVKTGDKIAELELDLDGKLRASQLWQVTRARRILWKAQKQLSIRSNQPC